MKTRLLKRIRGQASCVAYIVSYTERNNVVTGMRIRYDGDPAYADLFRFGDTEEDVERKIQHIYYGSIRGFLLKKYKK